MARMPATPPSHMQDYEAHVTAVEADLEYFRTKRLESRVLLLVRRGVVTLYDILKAHPESANITSAARSHDGHHHEHAELEQRIRALEDRLEAYVREIALIGGGRRDDLVIEDNRKERDDYDPRALAIVEATSVTVRRGTACRALVCPGEATGCPL